jgi:hypothetical protein
MTTPENRIHALPCWSGPITIEPLAGGLSNQNYLGHRFRRSPYVVRFGKDFPFHHVYREPRDHDRARCACQRVSRRRSNSHQPGVMVSEYLGAQDLRPRGRARQPRARRGDSSAASMMSCRGEISGAGFMFWVFHVIRDYARTLAEGGSGMTAELPRYLALAEEFERRAASAADRLRPQRPAAGKPARRPATGSG